MHHCRRIVLSTSLQEFVSLAFVTLPVSFLVVYGQSESKNVLYKSYIGMFSSYCFEDIRYQNNVHVLPIGKNKMNKMCAHVL